MSADRQERQTPNQEGKRASETLGITLVPKARERDEATVARKDGSVVASEHYTPNWASGEKERAPAPDLPTQFEQIAEKIGVTKEYYVHSQPLKAWVKRNRRDYYVPEWLLREWGLQLYESDVSSML